MSYKSPKIIFFGTPQFSVLVLQKLIENHLTPGAIVTTPNRPSGRGKKIMSPPIKLFGETYHIPVLQPEKLTDDMFLRTLQNFNTDAFVIASYGKILPVKLLDSAPKGVINVHPSLLPHHRGPSPIQGSILAGDKTTGITLMLTDKDMDHGPILAQEEIRISQTATYQQLHDALADIGGNLLIKTLPKWIAGNIAPRAQDHSKATYTKLLTKEDGHIDWSKPGEEIDRLVRALNPWPGTWSQISSLQTPGDLKRLKILAGHPSDEPSTAPPGTLAKTKSGELAASTGSDLYIIERLQIENKRSTSGKDFHKFDTTKFS